MAGDQIGLIEGNPANRDYAKAIADWGRLAPGRISVYNWDTYRAEWPSLQSLAANMRYARKHGAYAFNPQYCGGPWDDMLAWLTLKLAWNIDADEHALIDQYLTDVFGAQAAPLLHRYFAVLRDGYEKNLHVPSAVRWSGWTEYSRLKFLPPARRHELATLMDQATAAARATGSPEQLANLLAARGNSLDVVTIDSVVQSGQAWGLVRPAMLRRKSAITYFGGGEPGVMRTTSLYGRTRGGPAFRVQSPAASAWICPDYAGQIVSLTEPRTNTALLAGAGYTDLLPRISARIWVPPARNTRKGRMNMTEMPRLWSDFKQADPATLTADVLLSREHWGYYPHQYIRRSVTADAHGLHVRRQFVQLAEGTKRLRDMPFSTVWRFAMPDSRVARVSVKGGGISSGLDLKYAVPGGIIGKKANEPITELGDWMDEEFDALIAASDAEPTVLPVGDGAADTISVRFDRGDGVEVILSTPATGWAAVALRPVLEESLLEVTLRGLPIVMGKEARELALPEQSVRTRAVPAVPPPAAADNRGAPAAAARLRTTGAGTAVNERDGAGLVQVAAGAFMRGSDRYEDEAPARSITLDAYWIYRQPVTLGQYKAFCAATGRDFAPAWPQGMQADAKAAAEELPVSCSWYEAAAYAKWAGASLPTEAEWERAARGTDGRAYPWGDTWDPTKCASMEQTIYAFATGFMPGDRYPQGASPVGALDMAGNMWEWTADWYDHDYYTQAPAQNPPGPAAGSHKVLRGGCAFFDERFSRTTARMPMPPHIRDWTATTFRCVVRGPATE
jgi:formylglycine-generating enzyme required for sulfatase activity